MIELTANPQIRQIPVLLGGRPDLLKEWAALWEMRRVAVYVAIIFAGAGLYGAAMGYWRSPLQTGYNFVKFPVVIFGTALGTALRTEPKYFGPAITTMFHPL